MMSSIVGKWIAGKLLGFGWDTIKGSIQPPPIVVAFEKACTSVVNVHGEIFNHYSGQAIGSSVGVPDDESLWFRLDESFATNRFPDIDQLTEMLLECWRLRKSALDPSEAAEFFSTTEDIIRPIIRSISERFFVELAQMTELANPFIIQQLLKIPKLIQETASTSPRCPQVSFEVVKEACLKTSTSLLSWPTTLGDNQWLDRCELETLLQRIDTEEKSTTILLGPPGSGKSALLSILGQSLQEKGFSVLAIKADKLSSTIDNLEKLSISLNLPLTVETCLRRLAMEQKTILIIDQMDALSELVDRKSERLNVLLSLVQAASSLNNVHVISSSRLFEFRHDTRLNTIQADHLELQPLSWDQVQGVLSKFAVTEQNWSDESQSMFKVPLHLKIFLDLRARNASADLSLTLQGLLEALWQQRVLRGEGAASRNLLLHELAERMSEDEELWVPIAIADIHSEALEELERQEILTSDENGLRIGFRHQTYFDFARARHFSQGRERLSEYVINRQDGLFIRPILMSSLAYLRGSTPGNYRRELLALWDHHELRFHLRNLLVEFLGALENPLDFEIACLIPVIKDDARQQRALISIAGSHGWFNVLKEQILAELMTNPPDRASTCLSLLIEALKFDKGAVLDRVQRNWLYDPRYDLLTLQVLQSISDWDEQIADMVCLVAGRTTSWQVPYIAEIVSQQCPHLAPRIVRSELNRKLLEAESKDAERSLESPPQDASLTDLTVYAIQSESNKSMKGLLDGDSDWSDLSAIAESSPDIFLDQIWPWFVDVLERITGEPHPFVLGYRDDHCLGTKIGRSHGMEAQPVSAIKDAIELLSKSDPVSFQEFFFRNESSNLLAVHRLLCKGLQQLSPTHSKMILDYLVGDPRRFVIGDFEDSHRESVSLISCIAPFLGRQDLDVLENAVLKWDKYCRIDETWTPEDRLKRLKWNREHRLRLLCAFPYECLSPDAQRIRNEEERAFPRLRNWDSRSHGGFVGSRMSADQMEKASDSDILKLFEELVDSTGWDHPRFQKFELLVGGAIQASRELGSFAEREPARAASIITQLKSGDQELAAGAILQGLAKTDFPSEAFFQLVEVLNSTGFHGNHYHTDVARALEIRAEKDKGLPDKMLVLLETWLPLHPEPRLSRVAKQEERQSSESMLWGLGGGFSLPGGRDVIFDAIAKGYLLREPKNLQGWAAVLERAIKHEQHPDVWKVIISRMAELFNGERVVATDLYDQVLTKFPQTRESSAGVLAVACIVPCVDDLTLIHKWLDFYRDSEWTGGHQAFGEILLWHLFHKPTDTWAQNALKHALENQKEIDAILGIAFAAAYNWGNPICQELCTSTLISLTQNQNPNVHHAFSILFRQNEAFYLNDNMKRLIATLLTNNDLLFACSLNIIEGLESVTSSEPELVFNVCNNFLSIGADKVRNTATKYAHLAEPLVSIALTLHRMPSPNRERGLLLFERLSESSIQEARQALDTLDRRPLRGQSSRLPMRRRRRRQRK